MTIKPSEVDDDIKTHIYQDDKLKSRLELEMRDKSRLETFVDGVFAIAIHTSGFGICSSNITTFIFLSIFSSGDTVK